MQRVFDEMITNSEFGDHNILIYPDIESFKFIYTSYAMRLNGLNHLLLIISYYETVERVTPTLENAGVDIKSPTDQQSLIILDSVKVYSSIMENKKFAHSLLDQANKLNKNGLIVISDMASFQQFDKTDELVNYELSWPSEFDKLKMKAFCCYNHADFQVLSPEQRQKLLDHHRKDLIITRAK